MYRAWLWQRTASQAAAPTIDYRLLLQLESIRRTRRLSIPWDAVNRVFTEMTIGDPLQGLSLKSEMEGVVKEALRTPASQFDTFLGTNLELCISGRNVGVHLMKYGILRQHLRNPELIKTLNLVDSAITNGLVVDLQQFSNIENVDRRAILENLGVDLSHMNDRMLSNKISTIMKRYVSLRKTNTEKGRQAMNKFLEENWLRNTPSKPHERSAESFTATETALSKAQNQNSALIRQVEDHDQALALVGERADTLDAILKEKNNRLLEMGAELGASRANVQKLEAALLAAKDDVASLKATIKRIRGSNYYKRIQRAERCVKAKENIIREHEGGGCRRKVASLRRKVKLEQTKLSNTQKVTDIVDTLKLHNGPCTSVEDLDRMLQQCTTMANLKTGLRAEVMFQKLVLQKKSPLLLASGKPLDVMNRLRQYFGAEVLTRLPLLQQPPAKRRRLALADVEELDEDDEDEEDAAVDLATEDELEVEFETNFVFRQVGEVVGVYNVESLFVGQVMSVENEENATVNFLESARGKELMFRWPSRPDCCSISSSVVFAGNITLAPLSNSGRTFIVESPSDLPARYDAFKQHLIRNYAL